MIVLRLSHLPGVAMSLHAAVAVTLKQYCIEGSNSLHGILLHRSGNSMLHGSVLVGL